MKLTARYAASGPEGTFYTNDRNLAEKLFSFNGDLDSHEWTITDLSAPAAAEAVPVVGPIARDERHDRTCIPLPGGWEIQTKGNGSTFRVVGPDNQSLGIPSSPYLHDTLEQMASDIHAACTAPPTQGAVAKLVTEWLFDDGYLTGNPRRNNFVVQRALAKRECSQQLRAALAGQPKGEGARNVAASTARKHIEQEMRTEVGQTWIKGQSIYTTPQREPVDGDTRVMDCGRGETFIFFMGQWRRRSELEGFASASKYL